MKKFISLMLVLMMFCICSISIAFAIPDETSLDEVISSQQEATQSKDEISTEDKNTGTYEKNKDFIDGLNEAGNLATADVEGAKKVTDGIKQMAAWLVQVLSTTTIILLSLRVLLDLTYIGLPFVRSFLGNGFQGNAQAGGSMSNSMGMNGGMGGGMGMNGGMGGGMDMGMGGMEPIGMQSNMSSTDTGRKIQFVSNAALNAVAGESSVEPDGREVNPFKVYCKDMIVVFIMVPVLITLTVTGTLTNLGFLIGSLLMDLINSLGNMI